MNKTISIITPWKGHPELIPDYEAAVQGGEVITVDNSIEGDVAAELLRMTEHLGGTYIRNTLPAGFAFSNNQGLREASGDIILFLNNDIRAETGWMERVREDVQDSALYGPSLEHQIVYGFLVPYLEGWCVAATRGTWESLNGWDAQAFRDFYWEDNDLAFRASVNSYGLIRTDWAVSHKGGATIAGPPRYGDAYERNRAIFASRVRKVWERLFSSEQTLAQGRLRQLLATPTDIQAHLPLLFTLARGNVLELGVRSGNSTTALLAGVELHRGNVCSIDLDPHCADIYAGHSQWTFICGDSKDPALSRQVSDALDLLLVDTEHTYPQVVSELEVWAPRVKPGGMICVHDTESFPETRRAVVDYCDRCQLTPRFLVPSHGLAVIEVPLQMPASNTLDSKGHGTNTSDGMNEEDLQQLENLGRGGSRFLSPVVEDRG